jgi:hypothetical protein
MSKRFVGTIAALAIAAVLVAGAATAEKPVRVVDGNVEAIFNGGFLPTTLSEKKRTPISFLIVGELKTLDGTHPPALKELILEGDENAAFSVKGVPVCRPGIRSQQRLTPAELRRLCGKSLVGGGRIGMEILFPDMSQPPIPATGEALLFNGGRKGGVTTLYLHTHLTVPTPAWIITTVKVKRIDKGRYGLRATATIPKIAGGSGSITYFNLKLNKGILSARCPDGRLYARVTATFASTPPLKLNQAAFRSCTAKVPNKGGSHE